MAIFEISMVKAHIGRSAARSTHAGTGIQWLKNGNFKFLLLKLIQADQVADLPLQYRHLMSKNGNFRFLLLKFIQADQLADLLPFLQVSSVKEQQFQISIVKVHIGRSAGRSNPPYRHLVSKNGIFRFLLLKLIQADHVADLPPSSTCIQCQRMAILDFYC